jgi:hypothetical protein
MGSIRIFEILQWVKWYFGDIARGLVAAPRNPQTHFPLIAINRQRVFLGFLGFLGFAF